MRYFVAAYEAKSFSRAKDALDTVQSNVSLRIRNLENSLGVTLFERRHRCVVPTAKADTLYRHAIEVLEALDRTQRAVQPAAAREGGFTLLELLVVVVIIGLLVSYVAPRYFSQVGRSEAQVARAQIDSFEKALDLYRMDLRRYPSSEQGLQALHAQPASEPSWKGPYLKREVPLDPWGRPYVYRAPGQKSDFELISYGRDGKPGGNGEDADITN